MFNIVQVNQLTANFLTFFDMHRAFMFQINSCHQGT